MSFSIPPSKLIHIDVDHQEIGKTYPTTVGIVADAKLALIDILDAVSDSQSKKALSTRESYHSEIAREKSKNWQRVLDNLQATLQSILNQIDGNFVVYIATNDQIELQEANDPRVFLVPVPSFKMPLIAQKEYNKSNFDANAKRVLLTEKAYSHNAPYIMYCDADDLVSNTLVQFVNQNPHPNGYAIRHGYVMDYSSGKRLP